MKNIVMTGATSGFGINWLHQLGRDKNNTIFVLSRNREKFKRALGGRRLAARVYFVHCDLESQESIRTATQRIAKNVTSIDLLVNNAVAWPSESIKLSKDGVEVTLAVNQIAPYILTGQLLPLLKESASAQVINTASFAHENAWVDFDDVELKSNFRADQAYSNSKLYAVLFTKKLAELLKNTHIKVNCFDPGIVDAPGTDQLLPKKLRVLYPLIRKFIVRTPEKAAETGVFLSSQSVNKLSSGTYFRDCQPQSSSKQSNSGVVANWLWNESIRLTGFTYPQV